MPSPSQVRVRQVSSPSQVRVLGAVGLESSPSHDPPESESRQSQNDDTFSLTLTTSVASILMKKSGSEIVNIYKVKKTNRVCLNFDNKAKVKL